MISSLSENSIRQYDVCLRKWWSFCQYNSVNYYEASVPIVISFLTQMFNEGCQYGTLNSYRSALSLILGPAIAKDDRLQRFLKGVFRIRPPLPKYNFTWDTNCVLDHLSSWFPNEDLPLNQLTKKAITLLALTTAHRMQTFSKIKTINIEIFNEKIMIKIPDIIKTSRPGARQPILLLPYFNDKPNICPAKALECYLHKTSSLRKSANLFIGVSKPHKAVGSQTLSRWVKCTLSECGLDTNIFSAHSTRHAATSRAQSQGISVDVIRNTAGWSGNSNTFAKYYKRNIINEDDLSFARAIINNN